MKEPEEKDLKLYYSIGEVAKMYGVPPSTLKFWEKTFTQIKPRVAGRKIRQYRKEDVEMVGLIHYLLKVKGMKIMAAQQRLQENREKVARNREIYIRLLAVRKELQAMRQALDSRTTPQE